MKAFFALCVIFAVSYIDCGVVPATTLVRTPSFDSAIVKSERLGGNFAYSTVEGHAYAAVSPVVQRVSEPVGVSYTAHQVHLGHINTPIAVTQPIYAQHEVVSHPIYSQHEVVSHPIYSQQHLFTSPTVISSPVHSQVPISGIANVPVFGGVATSPVVGGIPSSPVVGGIASVPAAPANPAPTPVQGTVVDADTVAVESA